MRCLLLSPARFWVGLTVIRDCVLREMSIKVPASVLGIYLEQERPLCQCDLLRETAQRLVCFETKPLFELQHSSQLASLPLGYRVMTDIRYVNCNFPKPSCGDTELAWRALKICTFCLPCCWQLRATAVPCPLGCAG